MFVDVHTHLTHEKFSSDQPAVIQKAIDAGLASIVVNGLDPKSNRQTLKLAEDYEVVKAALGMYPINAACHQLPTDFKLSVDKFNIDEEISYIEEMAKTEDVIAIGEVGLDGYWLDESTHSAQEYAFTKLSQIAIDQDIPVIVHSRKLEKRCFEILENIKAKKVVFHCYGGKVKLALSAAKNPDWCFSIPANAARSHSFQKMLSQLPEQNILTETDAPYLSPTPGERNEPKNVLETIKLLAQIKNIPESSAKELVWSNYRRMFCRH